MITRIVAATTLLLAVVLGGSPAESRYKLRSGDSVDLSFIYVPEFNQALTIQPDGYITLRGVGEIRAGGLTVPELKKNIEAKYNAIMRNPEVSVEIKDFEKPFFLAQGEVQKPGKYELRSDLKISEAVAVAGGLSGSAKHSQVLLFRRGTDEQVSVQEIDLKRVLQGKNLSSDLKLLPGDMVFVPKSRISKLKDFANMTYLRLPIPY